jgi:hypothetical protein
MMRARAFLFANAVLLSTANLVPVSATSGMAPPADFTAFTKAADAVVVGRYVGSSNRTAKAEANSFAMPLTDMRFALSTSVKSDARMTASNEIVVTTSGSQTNELPAAFEPGQEYVLYLKWNEPYQTWGFSYGLSGSYKVVGNDAVPMNPKTELVKRHGHLSRAQLVERTTAALR